MAIQNSRDLLTPFVVDFLHRNRFSVKVNDRLLIDSPLFAASSKSCRLHIAIVKADGSNWNAIDHFSTANEDRFVVFRGRIYAQQPILWTVLDYFWFKFFSELGISVNSTPTFAIWADRSCDAKGLPWDQLSEIPG